MTPTKDLLPAILPSQHRPGAFPLTRTTYSYRTIPNCHASRFTLHLYLLVSAAGFSKRLRVDGATEQWSPGHQQTKGEVSRLQIRSQSSMCCIHVHPMNAPHARGEVKYSTITKTSGDEMPYVGLSLWSTASRLIGAAGMERGIVATRCGKTFLREANPSRSV